MVLASGTGTLLASLLEAAAGEYPARVVAVGADRDCRAVEIATAASLPTFIVRLADHPTVMPGTRPSPLPPQRIPQT
ncbi:putative phosphoribosylglycinamide formyltransferase [Mycobacterium xenopi 3993]|nr:putative phosphoribosylglycinamide formyltransferase [Mycobacterium xenopi 3993]